MPDLADLVAPAHHWCPPYEKTFGPEVVDLAASVGLELDGNQAMCLNDMFSVRPGTADSWNVVEDATVCDRQNLKTVTLEAAALAKAVLFEDDRVVWTAHEYPTSVEAFRDLKPWFTDFAHISRTVKQVYEGKGDESIEFMDGRWLLFRARTKHGGRGISGDTVILDEAQKLAAANMGALVPTISARQRSQILYGGTAGDLTAHVWRRIRDRGRAGHDTRLAFREWCAPVVSCESAACTHVDTGGCALDRMDLIILANPALPLGRLRKDVILTERQTLPPAEFMRERLGWWEDPPEGGGVIDLGLWHRRADPSVQQGPAVAYSLEVGLGRTSATIGAGWLKPNQQPHLTLAKTAPGTDWIVPTFKEAARKNPDNRGVTLDGGTEALSFKTELEQAGLKVHVTSTTDRAVLCGRFYDAVEQNTLTHDGQELVERAIAGATWRETTQGARTFARRGGVDITPLYALVLAHYGTQRPQGGWMLSL